MTFIAPRVADEKDWLQGETGPWELIIGLEVHAQVASIAKLFSGAPTAFGAEPNTQVALVDAGLPGMLPVVNKYCVEQAVRTGLGLNAQINKFSRFDRKNYFYVDLPQGYQISQFEHPVVGEGEIEIVPEGGEPVTVGIERLHLEQDAGKSIHDLSPDETYVDLNRSGVALMEIVSKPDMRSAAEASAYVDALRQIVRALGTCDGDMEKGNLRADVNVSVRKPGGELGTRCEIKNVNSLRFIRQAIGYEARRHIEILEAGGEIDQETRLYDTVKGETRTMRSKEDAHDYRYFPDPDLLPLELSDDFIDRIKADLPELPAARKARFVEQFRLPDYDAGVLTSDKATGDYFEIVAQKRDPKSASNWMMGELFGRLNADEIGIEDSPVSADALGGLIDRIADKTISGKIAKDVFSKMFEGEGTADEIIERDGLKQVTDMGAIEAMVDEVIAANRDQAEKAKDNPKLVGFFVGQVMKKSQGKANPQAVNELLRSKLGL
ncbi:Asp-tRNA(Asn)/Glu-tRNA(Gln) amidotransferase subunit GatB [uncultured Algimonas sp.]|uniref:Asp-tRNA(Asn)/Glu-tRNA(Gln) amidotransferase subunit GatB n=1 Tax=uncultured Algimonas sp. TaxID=1547920 RepID=UPI00262D1E18|nr:Asp-tRNA(Asn)/Glu-tRNA(Gln) amidotransferase subunit GatB [uncultured Algimonas sp.]